MNTNFHINGYTAVILPQLVAAGDTLLEHLSWEPAEHGGIMGLVPDSAQGHLQHLFDQLHRELLSSMFTEVKIVRTYAMNGYDRDSVHWHNDHTEGHNMTVVLHMRDMTEETGGHLQIQNTMTGAIDTIIPKRGMAIVFSHAEMFNHRVVPQRSTDERVAIFFDCQAA